MPISSRSSSLKLPASCPRTGSLHRSCQRTPLRSRPFPPSPRRAVCRLLPATPRDLAPAAAPPPDPLRAIRPIRPRRLRRRRPARQQDGPQHEDTSGSPKAAGGVGGSASSPVDPILPTWVPSEGELDASPCSGCGRRRGRTSREGLPRSLALLPTPEPPADVERDIFSTLKLLRVEIELRPPTSVTSVLRIRRRRSPAHERVRRRCTCPSHRLGVLSSLSKRDSNNPFPVLQECISHENVPALSYVAVATIEPIDKHQVIPQKCDLTALHLAFSTAPSYRDIEQLCDSGSDINLLNVNGRTALHLLLSGELIQGGGGNNVSWQGLLSTVERVLNAGANIGAKDCFGETPLLVGLRKLLAAGEYGRAAELGHLLIEAGSDPDAVNHDGRSALTYSVNHLDDSVALTRLLLNCGASVWSGGGIPGVSEVGTPMDRTGHIGDDTACGNPSFTMSSTSHDRDQSAFTWFLRAVIRRRRVEHCSETLALLSQVMGECPRRMHSHVLRTMFRHVKCYKILGPVFYQLKLSMMRYWTQPHDLRYLCWRSLRKSLRSGGHLVSGAAKLGLPKPVQQYLLMET